MSTKKGLGRGLSALIPDGDMEFLSRVARGEAVPSSAPLLLEIAQIEPNPFQPRRNFSPDEMRDLVASVREHGIIQPVLVRSRPGGGHQLIAGERRWRAAQEAGLTQIPAVVHEVADQQALELAIIENVQRHDISALDAARAYRRLTGEFGLTLEQVGTRVGKSRPAVSNTMRLLDLPAEAQQALEDGVLTEGHGRAILLAPGDGARRAVLRRILRDKVTVREAEELARRAAHSEIAGEAAPRRATAERRAHQDCEEELSRVLGTHVQVRPRAKGGQLCITFHSAEDLDHLVARLRGAGR